MAEAKDLRPGERVDTLAGVPLTIVANQHHPLQGDMKLIVARQDDGKWLHRTVRYDDEVGEIRPSFEGALEHSLRCAMTDGDKHEAVLRDLRQAALRIPGDMDVRPEVRVGKERALKAVHIVEAALNIDPTLVADERCRRQFDLLAELFRQLRPITRQAQEEVERRHLIEARPALAEQMTPKYCQTAPDAPDNMEALSARAITVAEEIKAEAWPNWDEPHRIRERSVRRLPSEAELEEIADDLRRAVASAMRLPYPSREAVRLAGLADEITNSSVPRRDTDA